MKSTKITINKFDDLIRVAESNVLTPQQFKLVLQSCKPFMGIFLKDYNDTIEMAKVLIEANKKRKHNHEKPIFLDLMIDVLTTDDV